MYSLHKINQMDAHTPSKKQRVSDRIEQVEKLMKIITLNIIIILSSLYNHSWLVFLVHQLIALKNLWTRSGNCELLCKKKQKSKKGLKMKQDGKKENWHTKTTKNWETNGLPLQMKAKAENGLYRLPFQDRFWTTPLPQLWGLILLVKYINICPRGGGMG